MRESKVDYHIHTTFSDGKSTPTQIIKQAKELEYDAIAITDHDNVDGLEEARIAGEAVGLTVVPGIEIAVSTPEGIGLHILGYYIDKENKELKELLAQLIHNRDDRNARLLAALQGMGYDLTMDDLEIRRNSFLGKPIFADALVRKGYIEKEIEAYGEKFLGSATCRAVRKAKPPADEAIGIIRRAGGIPVLAHPIQIRGAGTPGSEEFYSNLDDGLSVLRKAGLKGLECYYPEHTDEQALRFVGLAEKHHLHITTGTDFHGSDYIEAVKTGNYR